MTTRTTLWAAACAALMSFPSTAMFEAPLKGGLRTGGATSMPHGTAGTDFTDRATLVAALERLMTTGEPADTSHDDGQLLQQAVDTAIEQGDPEIERLAVRAATPLVPSVGPLLWFDQDPNYRIAPSRRLRVRVPVRYVARVDLAVDGGEFHEAGTVTSELEWSSPISTSLPPSAREGGAHTIRTRVHMTFGGQDGPRWMETRELPVITYGTYRADGHAADETGVRMFLEGPALASANSFDSSLPDGPLGEWLEARARAVSEQGASSLAWMPVFCEARTGDPHRVIRSGPVCSIAGFLAGGRQVSLWFRTGRISISDAAATWTLEPPVLEAIGLSRGGSGSLRLSELAALLDAPGDAWPAASVSLLPSDIVLTPLDARATQFRFDVTVRNTGDVDVQNVELQINGYSVARETAVLRRSFVRNVPRGGSATVTLSATFADGYGLIEARALPRGELGYLQGTTPDSVETGGCATRIANPERTPVWLVRSLARTTGCGGW
jgi:hypothetical protein